MRTIVHTLPDEFSVGFGEYFTELREKQNMSLDTLAYQSGFSIVFLRQVEKGERIPSKKELKCLAYSLETSHANLLFQAGYMEDMFAAIRTL